MQKMHVDSLGVGIHACGGDLRQPLSNEQNGPLGGFLWFWGDEILPSSVEGFILYTQLCAWGLFVINRYNKDPH